MEWQMICLVSALYQCINFFADINFIINLFLCVDKHSTIKITFTVVVVPLDNVVLQIYHNGIWGSICPDGWTLYEASAICHHLALGFAEQALQTDYFGNSKIILSGVQCAGNETNVFMCKHQDLGDVTCPGEPGKSYFTQILRCFSRIFW